MCTKCTFSLTVFPYILPHALIVTCLPLCPFPQNTNSNQHRRAVHKTAIPVDNMPTGLVALLTANDPRIVNGRHAASSQDVEASKNLGGWGALCQTFGLHVEIAQLYIIVQFMRKID